MQSIKRFYDSQGRLYDIRSYATSTGGTIRNDIFHDLNNIDHRVDKSHQSHEGAASGSTTHVEYSYDYSSSSGIYDDNLRLNKITYPAGDILFRKFSNVTNDRFNRVSSMEDGFTGSTEVVASYSYSGVGRLTKIDYEVPDFNLSYDVGGDGDFEFLNRWGNIKSQRWAGAAFKDRYDYEYDEVGTLRPASWRTFSTRTQISIRHLSTTPRIDWSLSPLVQRRSRVGA